MNPAHLHLILNHIPLFCIPLTLIFLIQSARKKNDDLLTFSLYLLALTSALTVPVFLTGDPAEDLIKSFSISIPPKSIHLHEGAAQISLILCILTAFTSMLAIGVRKKRQVRSAFVFGAIALAIASTGSLAYTSFLGGKIRHVEFQQ